MKEIKSEEEARDQLKKFELKSRKSLLIIDGETLNNTIFKKRLEEEFF